MLGFMFFHVYMLSSYVYMHVSMPMPISMLPHACVFGSMLSTCFCYIPCACALHAMFVCLDLGYVCHVCLLLCFMLVLASLVLGFATLDTLSGFVVK